MKKHSFLAGMLTMALIGELEGRVGVRELVPKPDGEAGEGGLTVITPF